MKRSQTFFKNYEWEKRGEKGRKGKVGSRG